MGNVTCTCKKCQNTFKKIRKFSSRKEADNWETFAVGYYDLCPDCYAKEQSEKLIQGEVVEMHYSEYKNKYANKRTIPNSYNKTTKTILVVVKTTEEVAEERALMQERVNASKSEIFKAAHSLAKAMRAENPEMTYRECLSVCLKKVYTMVREAKEYLAA